MYSNCQLSDIRSKFAKKCHKTTEWIWQLCKSCHNFSMLNLTKFYKWVHWIMTYVLKWLKSLKMLMRGTKRVPLLESPKTSGIHGHLNGSFSLFCKVEIITYYYVMNDFLVFADVVALLHCSRYSLGVMASTRGLIAGRLLLQVSNLFLVSQSLPSPAKD